MGQYGNLFLHFMEIARLCALFQSLADGSDFRKPVAGAGAFEIVPDEADLLVVLLRQGLAHALQIITRDLEKEWNRFGNVLGSAHAIFGNSCFARGFWSADIFLEGFEERCFA